MLKKLWVRLAALAVSGLLAAATTSCFTTGTGTTTVQGAGTVTGAAY